MKFAIKYQNLDWWFWAIIGGGIGVGLYGVPYGYDVALLVSVANVVFYAIRDKSLISFSPQVRWVWLAFMLIALWSPMAWFYWPLFAGMVLVVFFDRCGIARVLVKMPWNSNQSLS